MARFAPKPLVCQSVFPLMPLLSIALLMATIGPVGAVQDEPVSGDEAASPTADPDPADRLPTVLVLGDSISIGYTPPLASELSEVAVVVRPMTPDGKAINCAGTTRGVANIDDWLAAAGQPDVITFNFGLHDLKRESRDESGKSIASDSPADPPQADPEAYRRNLTTIADKLIASGAKLFFVTTTPVPPGGVRPHRDLGDPLLYNGIARQVVEPRGIEVIDLCSLAAEHPEWMRPANVHFTAEGSVGLAAAIATPVRQALADLDQAKQAQTDLATAEPWQADAEVVERASRGRPFNYREADVPEFDLPDPLAGAAGRITNAADWDGLREQTLGLFHDHVYGNRPPEADSAEVTYTAVAHFDSVNLTARRIEARVTAGGSDFTFPVLVYLPKRAATADNDPVPAVVVIQNRVFPDLVNLVQRPSPFVPVEAICKRGYAVAVFHTSHVDPDRKDGFNDGIRGFFARLKHGPDADISTRQPGDWGAISAWAWGASRVLDYLETVPQVDASRVAVIGHSRGGKTSAWAAASDRRFAAALVNESGCGGAALSRRRFGETIARITSAFPHWFCGRLDDYADAEDQLPVDQHQLMALIAPRAVAVGSAAEDLWADPRGEYLSLVHAAPVFTLLGRRAIEEPDMPPLGQPRFVGQTGYFVRPGAHNLHEGDWANYLDFLDARLK